MRVAALFLVLAACSARDDLIADFHQKLGSACVVPTGTPDDTVALYEFDDDPPGFVIRDATGHQDGIVLNGASEFGVGPNGCGRAFEFGADTRYITLPDFPGWDLHAGSVDFWFRVPDQVSASLGILSRDMVGTDTPGHISFWLAPDRTVVARLQDPEGLSSRCSATPLATGAWAKVGYNFGPEGTELYVNGELAVRMGDTGVPTVVPPCGADTKGGTFGNDLPWALGFDSSRSSAPLQDLLFHLSGGALAAFRVSNVRRTFGQLQR
jgi:Concanavalin A-like lectin/glucanases superfamily